jgi:hypothetical protein
MWMGVLTVRLWLVQGFWDAVTLLSQDGVAEDFEAKMKLGGADRGVEEHKAVDNGHL